MKKLALVFVIAVIVPSLVLAWIAMALIKDQQIVFERQQTQLFQGVCSQLVKDVRELLLQEQTDFARHVETLLAGREAHEVASEFDERLIRLWPMAEVGFVVSIDGSVLAPPLLSRPEAKRFRVENDLFLSNQEKVYWPASKEIGASRIPDNSKKPATSKNVAIDSKSLRSGPAETEFRQVIADASQGVLPRFLQNRLKVLMWYRSPSSPELIFGAQFNLSALRPKFQQLLESEDSSLNEICVALLDDNGIPVAQRPSHFASNRSHRLTSVEVGAFLPHWEIAAFVINPERMSQTARTLRLTLSLLVALLLAAIGIGSWLIVTDLKRQIALARQKTDFVSNVSHELKTPLTSIRMFSELLTEDRVTDDAKRRHYLTIISAEAARLTRLINNVLDFAKIERGDKHYHLATLDAAAIVRETVETYRPHLETSGFTLVCDLPLQPMPVKADRDALSQVIVNLLSNAEKYSEETKEIRVEMEMSPKNSGEVAIRVLDRGSGVPAGCEDKIFEQFFRAHDSLSSGIQGSGLGLTLARRIAQAHGGDVYDRPRPGGGSCFELRLPISQDADLET